jgi:REP element-mobilizing transposase RayT
LDDALIRILGNKARDLGFRLLAAGCAVDHVHVVGRLAPAVSLATLIGRMKGGAAFDIRHSAKLLPEVVWQQGYWAQSLDPGTLDGVARYVRDQRRRHDASHPAELWQQSQIGNRSL